MGSAPRRRKRERGGEREAELREHVGLLVWAGKDRRADQSRRLRLRYSPPLPGLPALSAPLRAPPLRPPDAASGCTRPKAAAGPAAGTGSCGAGFDAYLVKPIELDSLLAVLDSVGKSTRPH